MKPRIVVAAVVIVLAAGALWFFGHREKEFLYAGTVEATEVTLSSRLSAVIGEVTVREGETAKKGQALVRLSADDIAVAADASERELRRARQLLAAGTMARDAFDKLKFRRDDAATRLSWTMISAPADATVIARLHEPGEMVTPGTKLLTLADLSRVWAYVYIPQPVLGKVSLGMKVDGVMPESDNKPVAGTIVRINDEAEFTPKNVQTRRERTRLVYGVKIEFDNRDNVLKPGMTVEIKLPE